MHQLCVPFTAFAHFVSLFVAVFSEFECCHRRCLLQFCDSNQCHWVAFFLAYKFRVFRCVHRHRSRIVCPHCMLYSSDFDPFFLCAALHLHSRWRFGAGTYSVVHSFDGGTVMELILFVMLGGFVCIVDGSDTGLFLQLFFTLYYRLDSVRSVLTIMPVCLLCCSGHRL